MFQCFFFRLLKFDPDNSNYAIEVWLSTATKLKAQERIENVYVLLQPQPYEVMTVTRLVTIRFKSSGQLTDFTIDCRIKLFQVWLNMVSTMEKHKLLPFACNSQVQIENC